MVGHVFQDMQHVVIIDKNVYIDGKKLPELPHKTTPTSVTCINGKVYVNGFEYRRGRWRRTPAAIWHYMF